MIAVAVLERNGETRSGSNSAPAVSSMTTTGTSLGFVTRHVTVVSPRSGSHTALPSKTTAGAAGAGTSVVVVGPTVEAGVAVGAAEAVVVTAIVEVVAAVLGAAVVGTAVVGAAVVGA
jgi:hypothetical protein